MNTAFRKLQSSSC